MATRTGTDPQRTNMDWRSRWMTLPPAIHDSETRPFFLTSEFLAYVLLLMGLGIGTSTSASIDARFFWEWATLATIAYMLSRGLAKSGSRSRAYDPREDVELGRDR